MRTVLIAFGAWCAVSAAAGPVIGALIRAGRGPVFIRGVRPADLDDREEP